jgi:endothelin-converting enzyme/putative endopeptidase
VDQIVAKSRRPKAGRERTARIVNVSRWRGLLLLLAALSSFAQTTATYPATGIDASIDPCANFYKYACGTWLAGNPIPNDRSIWGRGNELQERNQIILRNILDQASAKPANDANRKIGAFYGACMDEKAADSRGAAPLRAEFDRIKAISDIPSLSVEVARLQRSGVNAMFNFRSGQDFKNSTEVIAQLDQGGLGLPEKDYYFKVDQASNETREKYVQHITKMFELAGRSREQSAADASLVMRVETELARASMGITLRRDPPNVYHLMTRDQLASTAPLFDWNGFFKTIHVDVPKLNVASPDFLKGIYTLLKSVSMEDWKIYLKWQTLHTFAPLLSSEFVNEDFAFFGVTLTGQKEMRPRWKRCVALTDGALGEALGQAYVDSTFGTQGKERTLKLVRDIEAAMEQDIKTLEWMTPQTRQRAIEKLHAIANKIGYPETWRDYSSVVIRADDPVGNQQRASAFEFDRQLAKIGKPVDKTEWPVTPPTVNAGYDPQMNNITFPAGILQPPFFDPKLDDSVNYGAIGAVVGHEITHAFDDQGRQFDAVGNLSDWWNKEDALAFEGRSKCIQDEYGNFDVAADLKQNGKLTEGENIADNGGLRIAYIALTNLLRGRQLTTIDGFTPQQRFFIGFAQIACTNETEKRKRLQAQSDPHSLFEFRVNGTVVNMPEFAAAFSCKAGTSMAPAKRCRVW